MPKTDRGQSNKPQKQTSSEEGSQEGRMVTPDERADLIEDAKAFKRKHEKAFRSLSESEGHE